jgi:hypothetical protein
VFYLAQNYPSPFNPSTVIQFGLPVQSHVRLTVMNVVGETVAELLDQDMESGVHSHIWTPELPSGVYFYRLLAVSLVNSKDVFRETRKTLLLK